jgi:glycolate oxidase FAD binding subunit
MDHAFAPENADEAREIVAEALASGTALEISGTGSKRAMGRPTDLAHRLSVARLSGVALYEPEELVLRAGPGTPMAQIALHLEQHGQMLAFEPPDLGPLFGEAPGTGTLGGTVACNLAGPRRVKSGAARDHFLGVEAVSGRGELFRSGGRVVKNVTGYDLCKLLCGAWGTLGVMTEVTVKVLPAPERTRTVLVACHDAARALRAMTQALSSPNDVSAAAWLPAKTAAASAVSYVSGAGAALCALRVEGIGASVAARCEALRTLLAPFGAVEELHTHNSKTLWAEIRDVAPFAPDAASDLAPLHSVPHPPAVWRVSLPPTAAPAFVDAVTRALDAELFLDWGGGLAWVAVTGADDGGAAAIRSAIPPGGGHATLVRGADALRLVVPVFQPESAGVAALTRRLKEAFDPRGILNPGRMYEGL